MQQMQDTPRSGDCRAKLARLWRGGFRATLDPAGYWCSRNSRNSEFPGNLQELRESGHRKSSLWAAEGVAAWAGSALGDLRPNLTKRDAFTILIDEGVFALLGLLDLKKFIEYLRMKV